VTLNGSDIAHKKIRIIIPELGLDQMIVTDSSGNASVEMQSKKISYWTTQNPHVYNVIVQTPKDEVVDQIGLRTIKTKGENILLNDAEIFLRGISIHEESPARHGRAHSLEDAKQLLTWAKELGCNYVRLAHYPHNEHMARLADKMGMLVWEEIPVYWTISWENEETYCNAEDQLTAMIGRDKNRASVIIWSMANETPTSDLRNIFLGKLAAKTRSLDPTRLISAALELSSVPGNPNVKIISDPFSNVVDILSFNQYIGWYDGLPNKCKEIHWNISQNKPVIISEFGADAKIGFHGDSLTRFSEEYQEYLYKETLEMISTIPQLRGISPWILVDFRSPRRALPNIQDGWNRKGLISDDGKKKKAFFVLQKFYGNKK
jgi:beta-glucuronidase